MNPRPKVLLSYAQSVDGRIATTTGDSRWISGDDTLTLAHTLRHQNDAIMVGIGTVLRDDPELSCRLPEGRSPIRVILDSTLQTPLTSRIAQTSGVQRTIVFCAPDPDPLRLARLRDRGIDVVSVPRGAVGLKLHAVLAELTDRAIGSLFVEGGAAVLTAFLRERLVDRLLVVIAPMIIGRGVESVGELGVQAMAEAIRFTPVSLQQLGNDLVWELRP